MIRVRVACSPTGHLLLGPARVALVNLLFARRHGGQVLLRLDDIDDARCKPEYAEAILQDLHWLGVVPDTVLRQSDRRARHVEAAEQLKRAGRLYPCFESEEELRAKRDRRLKRGQPAVYDRAMLRLTEAQRLAAEAGGKRPYWRFRLSDSTVQWHDAVLGLRTVKLSSVSDPVVLLADGMPTRVFAGAVDDLALGISHAIRGDEHLLSAAVQCDLRAALGGDTAAITFAHLPPLTDDGSSRWSRRVANRTLRSLRGDGIEATALAACLAQPGAGVPVEPLSIAMLARDFDLARQPTEPTSFDAGRLLRLNRALLAQLEFPAVADRLPGGATEAFWLAVRGSLDLLTEARGWWDVVAGTIVPPMIEGGCEILTTALRLLPPEPWSGTVCIEWLRSISQALGHDPRELLLPLRLALTGEDRGPDLNKLLPLIGRTRVANRLQIAAA